MNQDQIREEAKNFHDYIMSKYGSQATAKSYCSALKAFLFHFRKRPQDITVNEIISYLMEKINVNTRRSVHSAIKLYYISKSKHETANKFRYIPYPQPPESLPTPITKQEFVRMIQACKNIKHKIIMMLGFDAGLRVSEVVNLKIEHLNFELKQIKIVQSKGRKDRIVKLTSVLENFIIQYFSQYSPKEYLICGQFGEKYSARSCQEVVKKYAALAGINRNVTFHQNRHGFAVTLLENGTPLDSIRERLGHKSLKTTRIYAPLNNKEIQSTQSPMEQIMKENAGLLQLSE